MSETTKVKAPKSHRVKWEYKVISISLGWFQYSEQKLNELGGEGWEVVTSDKAGLILKRPR
jgi:hypothetical protein